MDGRRARGADWRGRGNFKSERMVFMKEIKLRLTFTEGLLGTSPSDEDIYRNFIGSKAPDAQSLEEEVAAIGADEVVEKGMTIFTHMDNKQPHLWDYQIKGFMKDACSMMNRSKGSESGKLKAYRKIIDGLIFVAPRKIPLLLNGDIGLCQRPIRVQTAQGERVALSISEEAYAGTSIELTIILLDDAHEKALYEWLNYGCLRGIGQWRNSGKGRFLWENLETGEGTAPEWRNLLAG